MQAAADEVSPNIEQRLGFVHLHVTDGTVFAGFQVAHDAHLANCQNRTEEGSKSGSSLMRLNAGMPCSG